MADCGNTDEFKNFLERNGRRIALLYPLAVVPKGDTMDAANAIRKLRYPLRSNCELGLMMIDIKAEYRLL